MVNKVKIIAGVLLLGGMMLVVGNAFAAPVPPPPTSVGGGLWPYASVAAILGAGAWLMWKKK